MVKSRPEAGDLNFNWVDVDSFVQLPLETFAVVKAVPAMEVRVRPEGIVIITDLIKLEPPPEFVILKLKTCGKPLHKAAGLIVGVYLSFAPSVNVHSACAPFCPSAVKRKVAPRASPSATVGTYHEVAIFPILSATIVHG